MARDTDAGLDALLATRSCREVFTLHVQMPDGEELWLATAPETVASQLHSPVLKPGPYRTSVFAEDDSQDVRVTNVDYTFGQTLCSAVNVLDGARATSGVLFIDDATGDRFFDEVLPGELVSGEVDEEQVTFTLVDELNAIMVAGERVCDVHPFRQPAGNENRPDPNDNGPRPSGGGPGRDPFEPLIPFGPGGRNGPRHMPLEDGVGGLIREL